MLRAQPGHVLLSGRRLWISVAGLSVDQLVAWGVLYYAYTVLSAPIALDLGVSRVYVAAAFSVCLLVAGWCGRLLGPILDARGTRGALRAGAIGAPLAFAAIALVRSTPSLVAAFALLGVAQAVALYEPAFRTVVDWCDDERTRGRALLALTVTGGLASTVFLPLTGWLVAAQDWRNSVLVLAGILAVVLVPTRFLLALPRHGRAAARSAPSPRSASRLGLGIAMHSFASSGVSIYLIWHLVERGDSLVAAAAIAGLAGASQIAGRLLAAPLRRAVGGNVFLPVLLAVQAAALLGVVLAHGKLATICILLFGAANGITTLERAAVLVEWYGRETFGAHQGRQAAAAGTARAIAPFLVEAGHLSASYAALFGLLCVVLALGAWICSSAAALRGAERIVDQSIFGRLLVDERPTT